MRLALRHILPCLLLLLTFLPFTPAHAATHGIAAVVNEDAITQYDLDQRLEFILLTTRLPETQEVRERIRPQVLRTLIDERLQVSEGKRLGMRISDKELANAIRTIEARNNKPEGSLKQFLVDNGITESVLTDQVTAQLFWTKIMLQRIRPKIRISDDEIQQAFEIVSREKTSTEYDISEILLPVENPENEEQVKKVAENLAAELNGGKDFTTIASEFSVNVPGGDVRKWVKAELVEEEVRGALSDMVPGIISTPIRSKIGYHIIQLHDKREVAVEAADEDVVTLKQVIFALPETASAEEAEKQKATARRVTEGLSSCPELVEAANKQDYTSETNLGSTPLAKLAEPVREMVATLKPGQVTQPFRTPLGIHVLMVCDRQARTPTEDEKMKLTEQLHGRRMELEARKYMRNLRRNALIDIRS